MSKPNNPKKRADVLLVDQGSAPTRAKAQSLIMAGAVYRGTERVNKASETFDAALPLTVKGEDHPYVSRGGVKLKGALDHFGIDVSGKACLDIGASTGGFTDCLLKAGAAHVVAIDVGYGQLAWDIRNDPRVTVFEKTNFRHFDAANVTKADLAVVDVSFISLTLILPKLKEVLIGTPGMKEIILLVKPQFEAGPKDVGKKGVVKDDAVIHACVDRVISSCESLGFQVIGSVESPITGPEGNREQLLYAKMLFA